MAKTSLLWLVQSNLSTGTTKMNSYWYTITYREIWEDPDQDWREDELIHFKRDILNETLDRYDLENLVKDISQDFTENHDGWESTWPVHFEIFRELEDERKNIIGERESVGVFTVDLERSTEFEITPFDKEREPKRLAQLDSRERWAIDLIDNFEFTRVSDGEDIEVWWCRNPNDFNCSFYLTETPAGISIVGDIRDHFSSYPRYGIEFFSRQKPCKSGYGYMREKLLGLNRDDPDKDYFPLMMLHYACKRIVEIRKEIENV